MLTSSCSCIVAASTPQETQLEAGKYCQAVKKFSCSNSSQLRQRLMAARKSQSFARTENCNQPPRTLPSTSAMRSRCPSPVCRASGTRSSMTRLSLGLRPGRRMSTETRNTFSSPLAPHSRAKATCRSSRSRASSRYVYNAFSL